MCVLCMHVCIRVKVKGQLLCVCHFLPCLRQVSLLFTTLCQSSWPSNVGKFSYLCLSSHRRALRLQTHRPMSSFHISSGELELHPHAYEPTPKSQPLCSHKYRGMLVRIVLDKVPHRSSLVSLKSVITIVMAKVSLSIYRLPDTDLQDSCALGRHCSVQTQRN